jgi:hypothetical protein
MIDHEYIELHAEQFGVAHVWQRVLKDLEKH